MRISDWSSDVCSSDLDVEGAEQPWINAERTGLVAGAPDGGEPLLERLAVSLRETAQHGAASRPGHVMDQCFQRLGRHRQAGQGNEAGGSPERCLLGGGRAEEHTSELQSLMLNSHAVF